MGEGLAEDTHTLRRLVHTHILRDQPTLSHIPVMYYQDYSSLCRGSDKILLFKVLRPQSAFAPVETGEEEEVLGFCGWFDDRLIVLLRRCVSEMMGRPHRGGGGGIADFTTKLASVAAKRRRRNSEHTVHYFMTSVRQGGDATT